MNCEISLSEDGTYLSIRVFEAITGEMQRDFAKNAIKHARQHEISKFLVDVRGIRNVASRTNQYRLGYEDMRLFGLKTDSKIAVLVSADDTSHEFIETIFLNAGYILRVFHDE